MKKISLYNSLFFSLGSIIGSGWLYGAYYSAKIAGNAAVLSWILGGIMMSIVALCYAEVTLNKKFTSLSHAARFSFGTNGDYLVGILTWIWTALIPPIEIQATVQYASNYLPWLKSSQTADFSLSPLGFLVSCFLLFIMYGINLVSINNAGNFNKWITIPKIIIPVGVSCLFFYVIFTHPANAISNLGTHFFNNNMSGMFNAISTGGIAFSLIGFQTAIFLAHETANPQKNVPKAVFGSLLITIIIYLMVQVSFNLALPSEYLKNGWSHLSFAGDSGPIAGLLTLFGFTFVSFFLYIDALISPMGTGLGYKIAASRILANLGEMSLVPKFFAKRNRFGSPYLANFTNLLIGIIFFLLVSGWQNMIAILCGLIILTSAYVPLYLMMTRIYKYNDTGFKLKYPFFVSFLGLYFCHLMLIWCGWNAIKGVCVIYTSLLLISTFFNLIKQKFKFNLMYHVILPFQALSVGLVCYYKQQYTSFYFETAVMLVVTVLIFIATKQYYLKSQPDKSFS